MLLTIQDISKNSWQVKVDLKQSAWETTGDGPSSGSPFPLFPKGKTVRDSDGSLRLVTALWDLLLVDAPRNDTDTARPQGDIKVTNCRTGPWDRGPLPVSYTHLTLPTNREV